MSAEEQTAMSKSLHSPCDVERVRNAIRRVIIMHGELANVDDMARAAITALHTEPGEDTLQARDHARRLAVALHDKHYPDVPQWKPLDDIFGLIDQIDNMTTGLVRIETALQDARDRRDRRVENYAQWLEATHQVTALEAIAMSAGTASPTPDPPTDDEDVLRELIELLDTTASIGYVKQRIEALATRLSRRGEINPEDAK